MGSLSIATAHRNRTLNDALTVGFGSFGSVASTSPCNSNVENNSGMNLKFWKPKPPERVEFYQTAPLQIVIKRDPIDDAMLCVLAALLLTLLLPRLLDALAIASADA